MSVPRLSIYMYTPAQLRAYYRRIALPQSYQNHPVTKNTALARGEEGLEFLKVLQQYHLTSIPFESLSLHYSTNRVISIDPQDVFRRIVQTGDGRGGYCMQVNTLFGTVLRSLGYEIYATGARVNLALQPPPPGIEPRGAMYMGWNHMVNIVTICNQRYLVDVGYGSHGPHRPLPFVPKQITSTVGPKNARLLFANIPENSTDQKLWIYQCQFSENDPWLPGYCFTDTEFLPADFEIMNLSTSNIQKSDGFFIANVLCSKMVEEDGVLVGDITLFRTEVKRRINGVSEVVAVCRSEEQRIDVLKKWFGVRFSDEERAGIKGLASELKCAAVNCTEIDLQ